jgi:hypothetical protein
MVKAKVKLRNNRKEFQTRNKRMGTPLLKCKEASLLSKNNLKVQIVSKVLIKQNNYKIIVRRVNQNRSSCLNIYS